jgi:hypothetical protein
MKNGNALQAGYKWEKTVFGKSSQNTRVGLKYQDFEKSIREALNTDKQKELGWDPESPKTSFSKELFACIQSYLPGHLSEHLEMYSSVGLSLDFYHGIDGFFVLNCGNQAIVTIDTSTRYKKSEEKLRADMLLSEGMHSGHKMWRFCKEVADELIYRHSAD